MAGLVTLTTDFGLRDAYVAEMKGVMLGIAGADQSLQLVDVTHDVERHDITEGALALEAAAPFFPPGTVHLAVVDPGRGHRAARPGVVAATRAAVRRARQRAVHAVPDRRRLARLRDRRGRITGCRS